MTAKSIFKSKTFWVNFITIGAGVLAAFSQAIPQNVTPWLLAIVGASNVVLRFLTKGPVKL